jgi:glycosyltransferase involved in cell wall biosynthesis
MGFQDGVDYFLRALHHLVFDLDRKDVYCLMMGSGDALPSLQEQVKTLQLEPYVHFTGFIDGPQIIASNLSAADICIAPEPSNPYNDRSTAAKVMEYMAIGKPVVAFDLPEHRHSAGEAALYALPNDEMDYARKIIQLMDDPALRQRMGQAGIQRIREELSWQQQEKALLAAYQALRAQP